MPRLYTVQFQNVSVAAAQDLFQILGAAGKMLRVIRVEVSNTDTSLATSQMLSFSGVFLPATVTTGSGGSAATPQKVDPGDAQPSFTAMVNNTTPATTSGSAAIVWSGAQHIYNGLDETFQHPVLVGPGEGFLLKLLSTVSGTVHLSGTIWCEELGG